MKRDYLKDRKLLEKEVSIDFNESENVSAFAENILSIQKKYKDKFGNLLHSALLEEVRTSYEDWYFAVVIYYYESESEFKERLDFEDEEYKNATKEYDRLQEVSRRNSDIDKEIEKLRKLKL